MKIIFGITLIELMISLVLSLFVLGSVSAIYLATQKNFYSQTALLNIQENQRILTELLSTSIRTAGYIGCAKLSNEVSIVEYPPFSISEEKKLTAYRDLDMKSGTDGISVVHASTSKAKLVNEMRDSHFLSVSAETHFTKGDILLIYDCINAEIFVIKEVAITKDNIQIIETEQPLNKNFKTNAELSFFEMNHYYISETGRKDSTGFPIDALYVKNIHKHKTELVEGVNDMRIHYDVLENNRLVERKSNEVYDWSKVVGVSIMLSLSSLNQFSRKKSVYMYVALREI